MIVSHCKDLKCTIFLAKIDRYEESPFMTHQAQLDSRMKVVTGNRHDMTDILKSEKFDFIFAAGFPWRIPVSDNLTSTTPSFNIHPSALPKYWGPDPVRNQILDFIDYFGVSIHVITKSFDAGNVIYNSNIKNNNQMCIYEILYKLGEEILPYVSNIIDKNIFKLKDHYNQKEENQLLITDYANTINIDSIPNKENKKDIRILKNRLQGTSTWKERLYQDSSV